PLNRMAQSMSPAKAGRLTIIAIAAPPRAFKPHVRAIDLRTPTHICFDSSIAVPRLDAVPRLRRFSNAGPVEAISVEAFPALDHNRRRSARPVKKSRKGERDGQ